MTKLTFFSISVVNFHSVKGNLEPRKEPNINQGTTTARGTFMREFTVLPFYWKYLSFYNLVLSNTH